MDALGDDYLLPGDRKTVAVLGCSADLRVVYESDAAEERQAIDICQNPAITLSEGWIRRDPIGAAATEAPSAALSVTVVNKTGKSIDSLRLFPDGREEHGQDLLGSDTLDAGSTKTVSLAAGSTCKFTLETSGSGSAAQSRPGIDLCATKTITVTASGNPEATFRNASPVPIVALFVDPPGAGQGVDRLGTDIVARGGTRSMVLPDANRCDYSITAILRTGRVIKQASNLCTGDDVVLN